MTNYFFYGDEDFLMELEINKLKSKLIDFSLSHINFKTLNNPSFADLMEILKTQSMIFGNLLFLIDCENYFSQNFFDEKQLEQISTALNFSSINIIFRVNYPKNSKNKIDLRKKIYKIFQANCECKEFLSIPTYKINELSEFVKKQAKQRDIELKQDVITALLSQVGNNLRELSFELDKLKLYAHPQKIITKKMIEEICISKEDLFSFADYILTANRELALREFNKLLEKKHPLEILSALQTMLRKWILIKVKAPTQSPMELSRLTGLHEFVVKQNLTKMQNTSLKSLVQLKQDLTEIEYNLKAGNSTDLKTEIETALIK